MSELYLSYYLIISVGVRAKETPHSPQLNGVECVIELSCVLYLYKYFILYPYIIPSKSILYACRLYQLTFEIPLEVYSGSRSTHWNRALIQLDPIPHSPNGVPNSKG